MPSGKSECLPYRAVWGVCDLCGKKLTGRQQRWCSTKCGKKDFDLHDWSTARKAARKRDKYRCRTCGSPEKLEVNHIIPRNGKGYGRGCWHHLDNLETLCRNCHQIVTNEQRAARKKAV